MNADLQQLSREIREALGERSQMWLAERSGVGQATVSRLLRAAHVPEPETLEAIGKALGLDHVHLMRLAGFPLPAGEIDPYAAYIARRISELPPGAREKAVESLAVQLDTIYELVMGETGVRPGPVQAGTGAAGADVVEDGETLEDVLNEFKGLTPEQRALIEAFVAELGPDYPDLPQQVKMLGRAVLRHRGTFAPKEHNEDPPQPGT